MLQWDVWRMLHWDVRSAPDIRWMQQWDVRSAPWGSSQMVLVGCSCAGQPLEPVAVEGSSGGQPLEAVAVAADIR